ncbi:MAG TPA: LysR substrate-binding domain-containing protein [Solirubrobacteraceae bacterium]|jgi:DNA-binding transcriptional LysR family regulator|nr:LysR substrate-binding domain-containing protein [Solirubrobacteraceae bacterium]
MDEKRLAYFLAIVDEGGLTKAAGAQHIAQPSLSQSLGALERELGARLFDRAGRGLRLTAAGHALIGPARQALRSMHEVRNAVGEVSALLAGTLEIAALPTLAVDPLADLVGRFRVKHPGVAVSMREAESAAGMSALVRDGGCELGLTHLPLPQQGLTTVELGLQELLFVLPASIDLGSAYSSKAISPAALAKIPLIVSPPGTSTRMLLDQAMEAAGVVPNVAVETDAREAIVPLVLAGAGGALLPAPLALEAERRGALVRAARPRIARRIGLVRREGPLSPAARAFAALAGADSALRGA